MKQENRMGVAPIPKLILSMSVPIMISMVVQSMYNIVDSIFVARISEGALTAAAFLCGKPAGLYTMQDIIG